MEAGEGDAPRGTGLICLSGLIFMKDFGFVKA